MMLVETADLLPGACFVTNRSDGPFIDTGYDVDDRPNVGRVYLAASFIEDCQGLVGGLGQEGADLLRAGVRARDQRIFELEQQVAGLTAANEALFAGGYQPTVVEIAPVDGVEPYAPPAPPPPTADDFAVLASAYEAMSDNDLIDACIGRRIEVPGTAERGDLIAALLATPVAS